MNFDGSTSQSGHAGQPLIDPIKKSASLSEQAYEQIKAAIIAGEVEPDHLYSVNQFATILGVSRTPVREALLALVADGLLVVHRNRGFEVTPVTHTKIVEIVEVRRLLEVPAMEHLATMEPPPSEALDQAHSIYLELEHAAREATLLEFLSRDRQFHLTLIDAVGNSRLTSIVADLRDHMHLPGLRRLAKNRLLHETAREHLELLEAIQARQPTEAAEIMSKHLDRTLREWS